MKKIFISCFAVALSLQTLSASDLTIDNHNSGVESSDATVAQNEKLRKAEMYMSGPFYTIILKKAVPPHGDSKNNYISMGPYWWPTSDTNGGLPYEYRDGQLNPESRTDYTDFRVLHNMCDAVGTLAAAYVDSNDERYVKRAQKFIEVFFIDPETRMLPNLNYAQFIPGVSDGSCFGIIETAAFKELLQDVATLSQSKSWSAEVKRDFDTWMKDYFIWLMTSELGETERTRLNNHGTHYDGQCMAILTYLGKNKEAAHYLKTYTIPRLEEHAAADGSQQKELNRTKSWNYSVMNLKGWLALCDYAAIAGVDLWHYEKNGQVYIKSMIDWYIPYLKKEKPWTWKQIIKGDLSAMKPVFERAAEIYPEDSSIYHDVINNLQPLKDGVIR